MYLLGSIDADTRPERLGRQVTPAQPEELDGPPWGALEDAVWHAPPGRG